MNTKIIEALNWRYACKQFDNSKKISDENFQTILESMRLTPSSYGIQPWKFVIVENPELREQLVDASWKQRQVADASHLIVICAPKVVDEAFIDSYMESTAKIRGQEVSELAGFKDMLMKGIVTKDSEWQHKWAKNQAYIALGQLMMTCAMMNIDACPMEGFQPSKYDEILNLADQGLTSMVVCPVGYRDEGDKYINITKSRFDLDQVVVKL